MANLNLEVFFEVIDFEKFKIDKENKRTNVTVSFANVYGILTQYNPTDKYFSMRFFTVEHSYGHVKRSKSKILATEMIQKCIKLSGLEREEDIFHSDGVQYYIHPKLFWSFLLWLNIHKFAKAFLTRLFEYDYTKHEIEVSNPRRLTELTEFVEWFGLTVKRRFGSKYISYPSILIQIEDKFHMTHKALENHKRSGEFIKKSISKWEEESGIPSTQSIPASGSNPKKLTLNRYEHPSAVVIYVLNTYPFELISILTDCYSELQKKKEGVKPNFYAIDLNTKIICEINRSFAIGVMDDLEVKFHRPTSYIHARSIAMKVNPVKEKHTTRWFGQEETMAYIEYLNEDMKKSKVIEQITTRIICSLMYDVDKEYTRINNLVIDQIEEHPSWFILGSDFNNSIRGYYFHPSLFINFIRWLDPRKALAYSTAVNVSTYRAGLEDKDIKTITIEEYEKLKQTEVDLQQAKKTIISQDKLLTETITQNSGSIVIDQKNDKFSIRTSPINEPKSKNRVVFPDVYQAQTKIRDVNRIIRSKSADAKLIRENHYSGTFDKSLIPDIQSSLYPENNGNGRISYNFVFNNEEFQKRKISYENNPNPKSAGFYYETLCSRRFNAYLCNDAPESFYRKFGLNKKDNGIDLIDTRNKILYQCKYYHVLQFGSSLQRTIEMLAKIRKIDPFYQVRLIVPSYCKVSSTIIAEFSNSNIIRQDFDEIGRLISTGSTAGP